jgi:hypothetical protein
VHESPLTLILFILRAVGILQFGRRDARGCNWKGWTGNTGEHRDNDRIVTSELLPHLFDGCASEPSDVFDHFVMVLFDVRTEGIVGHGVMEVDGAMDEEVATGELLITPGQERGLFIHGVIQP